MSHMQQLNAAKTFYLPVGCITSSKRNQIPIIQSCFLIWEFMNFFLLPQILVNECSIFGAISNPNFRQSVGRSFIQRIQRIWCINSYFCMDPRNSFVFVIITSQPATRNHKFEKYESEVKHNTKASKITII